MADVQRESWDVQDAAVYDELATLMNLSDDEAATLAYLRDEAERVASEMADCFYDRLLGHEHTAAYFDEGEMDARHETIAEWFVELFGGPYDAAYVEDRLRIGFVHVKIGLPVRYPLAMIDVVMRFGRTVTQTSETPEAAHVAFQKVLALDVAIFNQAYEDNQLQHLSDLVGGERLARRLLMGKA